MGEVYLAIDTESDNKVALKLFLDESPEFLSRIKLEIKALKKLTHPNITQIVDYGVHQAKVFLCIEFASKGTLKDYIANNGALSLKKALELILPIAEAVKFAHSQGIIHRDIKPENILLDMQGNPKLADLGIVKFIEGEHTVTDVGNLTVSQMAMGSPHYIAPEQALNAKNVTEKSDIYSLGGTLYTLLTGRTPFPANDNSPVEIMLKHIQERLVPPQKINSRISDSVNNLVMKMMEKNPDNRYDSVSLVEDLKLLNHSSNATLKGQTQQCDLKSKNNSFSNKLLMVTTLLVLLIALTGVFLFSANDTNDKLPEKVTEQKPPVAKPSQVSLIDNNVSEDNSINQSSRVGRRAMPPLGEVRLPVIASWPQAKIDDSFLKPSIVEEGKIIHGNHKWGQVPELLLGFTFYSLKHLKAVKVTVSKSGVLYAIVPQSENGLKESFIRSGWNQNLFLTKMQFSEEASLIWKKFKAGDKFTLSSSEGIQVVLLVNDRNEDKDSITENNSNNLRKATESSPLIVDKSNEVVKKTVETSIKRKTLPIIEVEPESPKTLEQFLTMKQADFEESNIQRVSFGNGENIFINDSKYQWANIPKGLQEHFDASGFQRHAGKSSFSVKEEGVAFLVMIDDWGGGGGGGSWQNEVIPKADFLKKGWVIVAKIKNSPFGNSYNIFAKECEAGETIAYRNHKYFPPILLVKK